MKQIKQASFEKLLVIVIALIASVVSLSAQVAKDTIAYILHEVQPKETVYSIARRSGLKEQDIYRLNPGSENGIKIGQLLRIPSQPIASSESTPAMTTAQTGIHIVAPGETLFAIARKYHVHPTLLKQYNPDIDPDVLKPGMEIRVALADGTSLNKASSNILVANQQEAVNVALLLPIDLTSGLPSRFLHFYEGFLMGIYRAKRNGLSVNLNVYATPDEASFKKVLDSGALADRDLVLGGQTAAQVTQLTEYTGNRGIVFVSPFITTSATQNPRAASLFKLNAEQDLLYPYLAAAFARNYQHSSVLFVSTNKASQRPVVQYLKGELNKRVIPYQEVSLGSLGKYLSNTQKKGASVVLMVDDSRKETANSLLAELAKAGISNKKYTIFGYPEWQAFPEELLKELANYRTTIYSNFFFDSEDRATAKFLQNYAGWYSKSIDTNFPKFALLGYDVANYFLTALGYFGVSFITQPSVVPSDGLQTHFVFRKEPHQEGFSNVNLFFVTFKPNGHTACEKVVF